MKIIEFFCAKDGKIFTDEDDCIKHEKSITTDQPPYLYSIEIEQERKQNPDFDQDALCKCGHSYYRHFDSYEPENNCTSCKYCSCYTFVSQN